MSDPMRRSGAVLFDEAETTLALYKLSEALGLSFRDAGASDAEVIMACAKRAQQLRSVLDVGLTTKARVLEVLCKHMREHKEELRVEVQEGAPESSALLAYFETNKGFARCGAEGANLANALASLAEKVQS